MKKYFIIGSAIAILALSATACGPKDAPATEFKPLAAEENTPTAEVIQFLDEPKPEEGASETVIVLPAIGSGENSGAVSPVATPVSPIGQLATEIGGTTMDNSQIPTEAQALTAQAIELVLQRAEINAAEEISVKNVAAREWPNAGLGCPQPGMMYAAVITPGYLIELEANGKTYAVHTNTKDNLILCAIDGEKVQR